jgi:copper chaperone CopZ
MEDIRMLGTKLMTFAAVGAMALGFGLATYAGDDCCGGKKDEAAKKDDCCKDGDKAAAKKDEDCKDGCCEKKDATAAAKNDEKKDGCEKGCTDGSCGAVLEAKAATFSLKVDGMTCTGCSGKVTKALAGIDGISKVEVSHETGAAKFEIAGGKTVKLGAIQTALGAYKLDESAKIAGIVRVEVSGAMCGGCMKGVCEKLSSLGIEKVGCSLDTEKKIASISFTTKDGVAPKAIKALFEGDKKFAVADILLIGAQKAAAAEKTKS